VTDVLQRLVDRADALERSPLLREVVSEEDGTKTVVIDMRDGTTRKFQTRVDWFDNSQTLSDPVSPELLELRENYDDQVLLAQAETRRAVALEGRVAELEELLNAAEVEMVRAREELTAVQESYNDQEFATESALSSVAAMRLRETSLEKQLDAAEVEAAQAREELWTVREEAAAQLLLVEERATEASQARSAAQLLLVEAAEVEAAQTREELWTAREDAAAQLLLAEEREEKALALGLRVEELEGLLSAAEAEVVKTREDFWALAEEREAESQRVSFETSNLLRRRAAEVQMLLEDRNQWKQRYATAAKVIEESLPALADLLSERTAELAKVEADLEGALVEIEELG
jgi:hypothetical protein